MTFDQRIHAFARNSCIAGEYTELRIYIYIIQIANGRATIRGALFHHKIIHCKCNRAYTRILIHVAATAVAAAARLPRRCRLSTPHIKYYIYI